MPRLIPVALLVVALLATLTNGAFAQAQQRQRGNAAAPPPAASETTNSEAQQRDASPREPSQREALLPAESITNHSITVAGRQLSYAARAGSIMLTNDEGQRTAEIFYVAYVLNDAAQRPVTFAFNGGPGASSAYLHLGALGPLAVEFGDGRSPPAGEKPRLVDNPDTWLAFTDLVFIDPVGTGYSHALRDVKDVAKEFWGVRPDLDSLAQIIRRALTRLDRDGAPVFLAGESYGGFRAARLLDRLPTGAGIDVAGAVLVSPVIDFSLRSGNEIDPLPWALRLPSYAAVNLEAQGKLTPGALADAERFALGDYVAHLIAPDQRRNAEIFARVAALTGLSPDVVARFQGRVPAGVFAKEIGRERGTMASQYDAAVRGDDPYPASPTARGSDPVFDGIIAPLTTAFVGYARSELQYRTDRRYRLINGEVSRRWDWGRSGPSSSLGASDEMRQALALNPRLKVLVTHGMTDIVTPYLASRYVVDHLPPSLTQDRVSLTLHPGGHMMYLRPESRAALAADARALYGE